MKVKTAKTVKEGSKANKAKTVTEDSKSADIVKWSLIGLIIVVGVAANYYYTDIALPIRLAGWLALACIVALVAATTEKGRSFLTFAQEARTELRKVIWPNRSETTQTTIVVIVIVMIMGLVLWGVDSLLLWVVSWITNLA